MNLKDLRLHHLPGGKLFERVGIRIVSLLEYLQVAAHKDKDVLRTILRARRNRRTLVTFNESFVVYSLVRSIRDLDGQMAEVGVYEGSTAKMICDQKDRKQLHLFDTFEGLPEGATTKERKLYPKRPYQCSLESVQEYLSEYGNATFHKGLFPDSTIDVDPGVRFCFVHMDVDLYESTLASVQGSWTRPALLRRSAPNSVASCVGIECGGVHAR